MAENIRGVLVQLLKKTSDPVYEQGYTFLVQHPRTDSLFLKVVDNKTGQTLAQLEHPMLVLLEKPNLQIEKQPFSVPKAGPETKIQMSLTLRVLKKTPGPDDDLEARERRLRGLVTSALVTPMSHWLFNLRHWTAFISNRLSLINE